MKKWPVLVLTCCTFLHSIAYGEEQSAEPSKNKQAQTPSKEESVGLQSHFNNFDEIRGVIVDRTITRLGDDFYFFFSQQLNEQYSELSENFTVTERPTALSGSIITVFHARKPIYRTALSPGRRQAKDKASEAVGAVKNYIVRWEAERQYLDTFDMEHEEF